MQDEDIPFIGLPARVCIGMPVHNGERFLPQAIESVLAQTFTDLQLIISDNASTDATREICESFARRDDRVHYTRSCRNKGAAANFNRVFDMSGGQYFKWAASDDLIEPTFVQRCVDALDADPSAVLAYPRSRFIDENGRDLGIYDRKLPTDAEQPDVRFAALTGAHHKTTYNFEIFGLMRRSAMDMVPRQGAHAAADRVFLARLALYGRFLEVPEVLFLSRNHPGQSIHTLPKYLQRGRTWITKAVGHGQLPPAEWFDPALANRPTFPEWRLMWEYLTSVQYGWLNTAMRASCLAAVTRRQLSHGNWARLIRDFVLAGDKLMAQVTRSKAPEQRTEQVQPPTERPARKAA